VRQAPPAGTGECVLADIVTVILAVLTAVLVGFAARRIFETPVGWPRSLIVGLLVFVAGIPFASWAVDQTGLVQSGRSLSVSAAVLVLAVLLISLAWAFAIGLAVLVALEIIVPTRRLSNPVDVLRAAIKQRRRTRRYARILSIASRRGADWLFHDHSRSGADTTREQRAEALVATINESGVTFVKLGQILATRRDLVPEPYLGALASLQSGASTLPWTTIGPVIEDGIGAPIETLFASIDPEPLAAASVAQVHTATLLDGTPVVVKVQRPAARAQVEADVDIVLRLARRAERHSRLGRDMRLESVARGFTASLLEELDYGIEATNTELIRSTLRQGGGPRAHGGVVSSVPKLYPQASGERVLTMEFVDGTPLSRATERLSTLSAETRDALAMGLMTAVIEQILVHGIFHADLHPGNVVLRNDGSLALIDFGAVGVVELSQRQNLAAILLAAGAEDDVATADALLLVVDVPPTADLDAFRRDIGVILTTQRHMPPGHGSVFTRMVDVIRRHRIALPGDLAAAFRSFATLEGCLTLLVPDFDVFERAIPAVPSLLLRMTPPRRLATSFQSQAITTASLLRTLPRRLDSLLTGVENGTAGIGLRAFSDGPSQRFLRNITGELVGALISIAAVVIAVVLVVSGSGPVLDGGIRLFDVLAATIGFLGFLGLLRVVRQVVDRGRN